MTTTSIEWTDKVWNPVTGCAKVSQGCKNCYAETIAKRFWGERKFTDVRCHEDRLDQPLRWKKPSQIFVISMSDLFHPDVPEAFIDRVLDVISACPQHTFQVLTKLPELLQQKLYGFAAGARCRELGGGDYCPNLWLGVSVEDQKTADERIPLLLQVPAAVRWVSYEPALGLVDFEAVPSLTGQINWVVCGGESGPNARPFDVQWARVVRDQCKAAGVPFFMKQVGSNPIWQEGDMYVRDRKGGEIANWPPDLRIREYPAVAR